MGLRVDRRAIGAPGHHAILQVPTGGKLAGHDPPDHQQEHDDPKRDQWTALIWVLIVVVRHAMLSIIKLRQAIDISGEPGGIRTHDPMIKSHVLYQLSYGLATTAVVW
jgi:hypothetical protein